MKFIKNMLITIVVTAIIAVVVIGYFGFIPGVSRIFGSDKPRDLGVEYSRSDWFSMQNKTGAKQENLPATTPDTKSVEYIGKVSFSDVFTGEELTATSNGRTWKYYPITNVQVRINADNSAEMSGILRVDRLYDWAKAFGVPSEQVRKGIETLHINKMNVPFYVKGTGSITNNKFDINLTKAEIGRFPIPVGYFSSYKGAAETWALDRVNFAPGVYFRSTKFEGGKLKLDMDYPEITKYKTE